MTQPPVAAPLAPAPIAPAPAAVYSSPIPLVQTTIGHAVASEWTKIRTVRSTMWSLGLMLVLVIGVGLLMTATVGQNEFDSSPILSFGLPGVFLGQLCVVALGVLVITSEYSTGMIRTTFTACPRRSQVLTAKALVFFTLTLALSLVACSAVAFVNWASLSDRQKAPDFTDFSGFDTPSVEKTTVTNAETLRATVGVALFMAVIGLLSLAVGTLLRHTAGAITTMLGVLLLPLLIAVFMPNDTVREKLLTYSAPNIPAALYGIPMHDGSNGWALLGLLAVLTAVVLGAAYVIVERRDV